MCRDSPNSADAGGEELGGIPGDPRVSLGDYCSIDWDAIRERYKLLKLVCEPIKLLSESELADYKLRESLGLPQRDGLPLAFAWGERAYPGSSRRVERIDEYNEALRTGSALRPWTVLSQNESGLPPRAEPTCFEIIEDGITTKTFSTEFLMALGFLYSLAGRQTKLLEQEKDASDTFNRGVASGLSQTTESQMLWYALWVYKNGGGITKRVDQEYALAELCKEIWRGERLSASRFPVDWYAKLIRLENGGKVPQRGECGRVDLKTPYRKLGWNSLVKKVEVAKSVSGLPSVDPLLFPRSGHSRP